MTALNPTVNTIPAYKLQIHWMLGEPEDISYTFYGPDAVNMLAGALPPNNGRLVCSFDGVHTDAVLLSTGAQLVYDQPGYVTESGKSIALALQQSAIIHRFTAQQITVQDAFNGQANAIAIANDQIVGNTVAGRMLPDQEGIALTTIGVTNQAFDLAFPFLVDPAIQGQVLDVDIFEDNLLHATQVIMERMGSFVDPQQTQYYFDSGATGHDGQRSVVLGRKGASSITFGTDEVPVLRATTAQAQTTDMCASCTFTGGDVHHGLPATGRITDLVDGGIVGFYSAIDVGGVYFWRGDAFFPISQAMGVNGLWYDQGLRNQLFAATDAGVYNLIIDFHNKTPWPRLGTMSLKCHKVQQDLSHVYCLAEFSGGSDLHVLKFTPGVTTGVGYDDWSSVASTAGITDFAVMGLYCYCVLRNNPGVLLVQPLAGGAPGTLTLPIGDSGVFGAITGLDAISNNGNQTNTIFIRTDQGSAALYYITSDVPFIPLQVRADSLVDDYGAPVMVNSVRANTDGDLSWSSSGTVSYLLAATSLGVFTCSQPTGESNWRRTDAQSSIGDFVCSFAAKGRSGPSGIPGRIIDTVYAAGDTAFYGSNNGSVNWVDLLSEPLDAGPFFYDYFWQQGRFPPATAFSIPVTYGESTYLLYRVLNGINQYCYQLVNPNAQAPAAQHRSAELSQISSSALMSPIVASRLLVEGMARFLWYTGRVQEIVEVESVFFDASSPLRSLRPTDAATVIGEPMEYLIAPDQVPFAIGSYAGSYFVLEHTITHDRDSDRTACTTLTRLGKLLLNDRQDPAKVTADLEYQVSRLQTYKSKARH